MQVEYKIIQEIDSPFQVKEWLEINRSKETHTVIEITNKIYIVVTRGEKRTGGYSVGVKNLDMKEKEIHIIFQYEDPSLEDIVMQVISYPSIIVEMEKTEKKIVFHILH